MLVSKLPSALRLGSSFGVPATPAWWTDMSVLAVRGNRRTWPDSLQVDALIVGPWLVIHAYSAAWIGLLLA
jgi:hypothetical protein